LCENTLILLFVVIVFNGLTWKVGFDIAVQSPSKRPCERLVTVRLKVTFEITFEAGQSYLFSGLCRNLRFTSAPIHGSRLNNHVIRTISVINEDFCQIQCYQEPNCVSYNFEKNGENKCDLNNATYENDNEHAGHLAEDENYVYREAEVSRREI